MSETSALAELYESLMSMPGVRALLGFLGGLISLWLGQKAARRNAKAAEKTTELDVHLQPLKAGLEVWQQLNQPLINAVSRAEKRIADLEEQGREDRQDLAQSLSLLMHYADWIERGALPPPPDIPSWLRRRMNTVIDHLTEDHNKTPDEGA